MNENSHIDGVSEAPWPSVDQRLRAPELTTPIGSEKAAGAVGLVKDAAKGVHQTIDRVADRAEPAARRLGERVTQAEEALHAKTAQLRQSGGAWAEGTRSTVRSHPLSCVAVGFALGAVLARMTR